MLDFDGTFDGTAITAIGRLLLDGAGLLFGLYAMVLGGVWLRSNRRQTAGGPAIQTGPAAAPTTAQPAGNPWTAPPVSEADIPTAGIVLHDIRTAAAGELSEQTAR